MTESKTQILSFYKDWIRTNEDRIGLSSLNCRDGKTIITKTMVATIKKRYNALLKGV